MRREGGRVEARAMWLRREGGRVEARAMRGRVGGVSRDEGTHCQVMFGTRTCIHRGSKALTVSDRTAGGLATA